MKTSLWIIGLVVVLAGGVMTWVKYNSGDQALSLDGVVLVIVGIGMVATSMFVGNHAKR